jgi:tetratricopeptide (TPR) repeat protein
MTPTTIHTEVPQMRPTIYLAGAVLSAAACFGPYPQRIREQTTLATGEKVQPAPVPVGAVPAAPPAADALQGKALADALVQHGDEFAAMGQFAQALDRYNRADMVAPGDKLTEFKIARSLDLQMQPREAEMRYRRFLNGLDIDRIKAQGDANAKLAEAIALAQQRLVVLERGR